MDWPAPKKGWYGKLSWILTVLGAQLVPRWTSQTANYSNRPEGRRLDGRCQWFCEVSQASCHRKQWLNPQLYRIGSQEPGRPEPLGGGRRQLLPAASCGKSQSARVLPGSRRCIAQAVITAPFKPGCVSTLQATLSGVSKSWPAFISHIQTNMKSTSLHGKRDPAIHLLPGKVLNVAPFLYGRRGSGPASSTGLRLTIPTSSALKQKKRPPWNWTHDGDLDSLV